MVQGAGSNVGKSMIVAGLARAYARRGLRVMPFKPQNMSNNAAVTEDGGEIGRAQALQARAAGCAAHSDMNPVLIKPESDTGAQIVVQGRVASSVQAADYMALKPRLLGYVMDSFARLSQRADLVLVEGAGSPAEVNLRAGDIANMGFARAAGVPVVMLGDIDRGGVIAQLVGTKAVIDPDDAAMICGFAINKFRGDARLFDDGYAYITDHTGWPGFGVIPWFNEAWKLPAEDAVDLGAGPGDGPVRVGALMLSRIANFDDLDPLMQDPSVTLTMIPPGQAIAGDLDLVVIPGSKSTRGDLAFMRAQGWDTDLLAHVRRGGQVLGICGGYQMLGQRVIDRDGTEGPPGEDPGLGLLDVTTTMDPQKRLTRVTATHADSGLPVVGYEIHIGQTTGPGCARPFARLGDRSEGAVSPDGRVIGTYLHGLFTENAFRAQFLKGLGGTGVRHDFAAGVDATLDALADHLEAHMDLDTLLSRAAPV